MQILQFNFNFIKPSNNVSERGETKGENIQYVDKCVSSIIFDIINSNISIKDLPSYILLITSKKNNIKNIFDKIIYDQDLSIIVKESGSYIYLNYLKTVIFTINENTNIKYLKRILKVLIDNDVCIEFDQRVRIL
ncbi:subtilisin propeptide-like protein [Plasmodium yoelii yoelii]|uniref:Subtilisin propeptide-like protein n=1 Tax=Plasmodium yoelii yoelii TaxID=73239 RepID=A0AAF0B3K8_PLAYO|nr:subtilisin propeptide-like protein [Plasmodium yoelii yoelii]